MTGDLEAIDDELLEAEREDGRKAIIGALSGFASGGVFSTVVTTVLLRGPVPVDSGAGATGLVAFSVVAASVIVYLVYRYSEDWLLAQAAKRDYIDTEDTA